MPTLRFEKLNTTKKKKIVKALDKVLSNQNLNAITVSDIVREAGISRGSFYTYFDDVEDATEYLIKILSNEYLSTFHSCIEEESYDYWAGVKKFYKLQKNDFLAANKKRIENIKRKRLILDTLSRSLEKKEYYSIFIEFSNWCFDNAKYGKAKYSLLEIQILNLNVILSILSSFLIDKLHGDHQDTYINTYIGMLSNITINRRDK